MQLLVFYALIRNQQEVREESQTCCWRIHPPRPPSADGLLLAARDRRDLNINISGHFLKQPFLRESRRHPGYFLRLSKPQKTIYKCCCRVSRNWPSCVNAVAWPLYRPRGLIYQSVRLTSCKRVRGNCHYEKENGYLTDMQTRWTWKCYSGKSQ